MSETSVSFLIQNMHKGMLTLDGVLCSGDNDMFTVVKLVYIHDELERLNYMALTIVACC